MTTIAATTAAEETTVTSKYARLLEALFKRQRSPGGRVSKRVVAPRFLMDNMIALMRHGYLQLYVTSGVLQLTMDGEPPAAVAPGVFSCAVLPHELYTYYNHEFCFMVEQCLRVFADDDKHYSLSELVNVEFLKRNTTTPSPEHRSESSSAADSVLTCVVESPKFDTIVAELMCMCDRRDNGVVYHRAELYFSTPNEHY